MLNETGGCEAAVRERGRVSWKKWGEIQGVKRVLGTSSDYSKF